MGPTRPVSESAWGPPPQILAPPCNLCGLLSLLAGVDDRVELGELSPGDINEHVGAATSLRWGQCSHKGKVRGELEGGSGVFDSKGRKDICVYTIVEVKIKRPCTGGAWANGISFFSVTGISLVKGRRLGSVAVLAVCFLVWLSWPSTYTCMCLLWSQLNS